eukprot:gnl/MRDRNA2_/MRDRNA2_59087_c0_seq1.p1 gnl/MRDRNA2_/MRDRNA2_59087_c0~~gnl/MRDRNA2_/MRDRNA2_59087_c0_seq1.p1  ORF type:complete len:128 (-),score=2.85 gnl/MRDRNA2_/MRDRNA2_59087_c0_seq1:45-428(-)
MLCAESFFVNTRLVASRRLRIKYSMLENEASQPSGPKEMQNTKAMKITISRNFLSTIFTLRRPLHVNHVGGKDCVAFLSSIDRRPVNEKRFVGISMLCFLATSMLDERFAEMSILSTKILLTVGHVP